MRVAQSMNTNSLLHLMCSNDIINSAKKEIEIEIAIVLSQRTKSKGKAIPITTP